MDEIIIQPVGVVSASEFSADGPHIDDVGQVIAEITIFEPFEKALTGIEQEKRIDVIFWLNGISEEERLELQTSSKRTDFKVQGVFANRRPRRPNPIGITRVELLGVRGRTLEVRGLDAYPDTPVLDIKPGRERLRSGAAIS